MQLQKHPTQTQKSKVKDTFLDSATSKLMAVKSISCRMSDSVLMIARLTSLPWVMDVRRRFSISLSLENYARHYSWWPSKLSTFLARSQHWEKCPPQWLSIIILYKNSSVLMFPGSSSLNISANMTKWHSSSTNELSRSKDEMEIKTNYSINQKKFILV